MTRVRRYPCRDHASRERSRGHRYDQCKGCPLDFPHPLHHYSYTNNRNPPGAFAHLRVSYKHLAYRYLWHRERATFRIEEERIRFFRIDESIDPPAADRGHVRQRIFRGTWGTFSNPLGGKSGSGLDSNALRVTCVSPLVHPAWKLYFSRVVASGKLQRVTRRLVARLLSPLLPRWFITTSVD